MELLVATNNCGKVEEIRCLFQERSIRVFSLADISEHSNVVEDGETFLANARKKAVAFGKNRWVLADDSGLCVEALDGRPGVLSARYSGKGDAANNQKILVELQGVRGIKRKAAFVCAMVLRSPEERQWHVEGRCEGVIAEEPRGLKGFGYDPIFFIPERGKTFAELDAKEKNKISHRGRALREIEKILTLHRGVAQPG